MTRCPDCRERILSARAVADRKTRTATATAAWAQATRALAATILATLPVDDEAGAHRAVAR